MPRYLLTSVSATLPCSANCHVPMGMAALNDGKHGNVSIPGERQCFINLTRRSDMAHMARIDKLPVGVDARSASRPWELVDDPVGCEPRGTWCQPTVVAMRAPAPVVGMVGQFGPNRVQDDIPQQLQQVFLLVDMDCVEPILQQMSAKRMSPVELLRILPVQVMHRRGQIGIGGFDKEVKMVRHQAKAVDQKVKLVDCFFENAQPDRMIVRIHEHVCAAIATGRHVIHGPVEGVSGRSAHAFTLSHKALSMLSALIQPDATFCIRYPEMTKVLRSSCPGAWHQDIVESVSRSQAPGHGLISGDRGSAA
ncbi:hypothetical protein IP91_03186 [Pseudoduganella lurida]|uniref:Uncharacterized protein n=1 Tax=Pseudoduganella lurida TaxID=1036180 RepID=A0A562R7R7_9BURK|nr:hypothetical protein IP91_03186 [Pseudoduganella lurida]